MRKKRTRIFGSSRCCQRSPLSDWCWNHFPSHCALSRGYPLPPVRWFWRHWPLVSFGWEGLLCGHRYRHWMLIWMLSGCRFPSPVGPLSSYRYYHAIARLKQHAADYRCWLRPVAAYFRELSSDVKQQQALWRLGALSQNCFCHCHTRVSAGHRSGNPHYYSHYYYSYRYCRNCWQMVLSP